MKLAPLDSAHVGIAIKPYHAEIVYEKLQMVYFLIAGHIHMSAPPWLG